MPVLTYLQKVYSRATHLVRLVTEGENNPCATVLEDASSSFISPHLRGKRSLSLKNTPYAL